MLPIFIAYLALLVASVVSRPHDIDLFISTLTSRPTANSRSEQCNSTCTAFAAVQAACTTKHCGCNDSFFEAQGDCLLCQTETPQDAATVRFLLDAEAAQCQRDGIPFQFTLQLPPAAEAIADQLNNQSAVLRREQTAFLALQIAGGHIGLVMVLAHAVFSRKVDRDPTFLNFCITWISSSIVYSLLLYRGTHGNTVTNTFDIVPPSTCLAQASLINGAQVMTACSTLALVVQLWIGIRAAIYGNEMKHKKMLTFGLLAMPYVLFLTFAITSVFVGRQFFLMENLPLQALPTKFYCTIVQLRAFLQATYGVTLGLLVITVIFDVLIIMILYQRWLGFLHVQTNSALSLSALIRIVAFSIYRVTVSVAYGTALVVMNSLPKQISAGTSTIPWEFSVPVWVDMLQASIPLVGSLILGINVDMIHGLMCWWTYSTMQTYTTNTAGASTVDADSNGKAVHDADTTYLSA